MKEKIAVLITCYNRKDTTATCLEAIDKQEGIDDFCLQVYLVDDGCTDGTGDAVRKRFPQIKVLQGDGTLYWGGGMRFAWSEAFKGVYDYYLWLNDDTHLYPHALRTMIDTSVRLAEQTGDKVILSGSTQDSKTSELTYGGVIRPNRWQRMQFTLIVPTNMPQKCETVNGNCTLIPNSVARKVGNFRTTFTHGLGDFDYGLRAAHDYGIESWITPGFIGVCSAHDFRGSHFDKSAPTSARMRAMKKPSGLPYSNEWMTFTRLHAGWLWPVYWLRTITRKYFPRLWLFLRGESVGVKIRHE